MRALYRPRTPHVMWLQTTEVSHYATSAVFRQTLLALVWKQRVRLRHVEFSSKARPRHAVQPPIIRSRMIQVCNFIDYPENC
jgi:hypothetical protein